MREQERGEAERQENPSEERRDRQGLTEEEEKGEEESKRQTELSISLSSSSLTEQTKSWPRTTQISFWKYFSLLMLVSCF